MMREEVAVKNQISKRSWVEKCRMEFRMAFAAWKFFWMFPGRSWGLVWRGFLMMISVVGISVTVLYWLVQFMGGLETSQFVRGVNLALMISLIVSGLMFLILVFWRGGLFAKLRLFKLAMALDFIKGRPLSAGMSWKKVRNLVEPKGSGLNRYLIAICCLEENLTPERAIDRFHQLEKRSAAPSDNLANFYAIFMVLGFMGLYVLVPIGDWLHQKTGLLFFEFLFLMVWIEFVSLAAEFLTVVRYLYWVEGVVPAPFTKEMMEEIWTVKS